MKLTKSTNGILPALALTLAFSSLTLTGCNSADASNAAEKAKEEKEVVAIPVEVTTTQLGSISSQYTTTTVLEPKIEAEVISKAVGIIDKIHVEEGDFVKAGQLLAEVETDRIRLNLAKAKAELASIEHELERVKKIHNKQLVSTDTYDKLKWQYEVAKSSLDIALLDLAETQIVAPISGFIAKRYVKEGNFVEKYQQQKLFHIVDQSILQGTLHLPEQELSKLKINQDAELHLTSAPGKASLARVERISPVVDAKSGTFRVTLEIENLNNTLKSGMFAEVKLNYDTHNNVVLLPRKSLISMDNHHIVYTVDGDKVTKTEVTLGYKNPMMVEVIQGLNNGQQVVIAGQNNLKDQSVVEIIESI